MARIGLFAALVLFALRIAIGFHFFKEGMAKVRNPEFSSSHFLYEAKGPLADFYRSFTPAAHTRERLDVARNLEEWKKYRDDVAKYYGFGRKEDIERFTRLLADLKKDQAEAAQKGQKDTDEYKARADEIKTMERNVELLKRQDAEARKVYERYAGQLTWLLKGDQNRQEVDEFMLELDRLEKAKGDPARSVAFRRSWETEKEKELRAKSSGWIKQIEQMRRGLERDLGALATPDQRGKGERRLTRLDSSFVDTTVTWLTVGVGVCLLLGLFTRPFAIAGALFLASVISTQPPWITEATPVYKEVIEMFALLLLAAMAAGRYGGLDYFIHSYFARRRRGMQEISHEPQS